MTRQEHLLVIVMEEASEVAKAAAKALRFGLQNRSTDPSMRTNAEAIEAEMMDLRAVIGMLETAKALAPPLEGRRLMNAKVEKVLKYLEVSKEKGTLT